MAMRQFLQSMDVFFRVRNLYATLPITGVASGSDNITTTAAGYADAGMVASVTAVPVNGNLYFATSAESAVSALTDNATVRLNAYPLVVGVTNLPVTLKTNNGQYYNLKNNVYDE